MKIINNKQKIYAGAAKVQYGWNKVMYASIFGSSLNGVMNLINQIVYNNNPNPLHGVRNTYRNAGNSLYLRTAMIPGKSTVNFGSPFI